MSDDKLWDGLSRRRISRRKLLQGSMAASMAAFLAACQRTVRGPRATTSPRAIPTQLEDALSIYNWENYINPQSLKRFEREFGVKPTLDFFASNEDLQAKIKAGAKGYDVAAPTGYMVEIMGYEDKTLLELDHSRIPNLKNCNERYLNLPFYPGNKFSVPKDLGTTGFGYWTDRVKEDLTTWEDFYRNASKYSGRYAVIDSGPEIIGSALKMLGYSYNTDNKSEIDEATNEILRLKPHVKTIDSANYDTQLERGEAWVVLGWNGDVLVAQSNAPKAGITYIVPQEGTEVWQDTWVILRDAPHPAIAHAFLNWVLQPEIQGLETSFSYYASAVDAAKDHVDPAVAKDPAVYPPEDVLARCEVADFTPDGFNYRNEAFEKFKAA
jgi:spermidine/putrescine transport system substrate-binding protein